MLLVGKIVEGGVKKKVYGVAQAPSDIAMFAEVTVLGFTQR